MKNIAIVALACVLAVGITGCSKKIDLTVMNHTDNSQVLSLTCPDGTTTIGSVGPNGGALSYKMSVPTGQLPAQCCLRADNANSQTFTVTEDSPGKWWFHITNSGQIAGPYGKNDVHTETNQTREINVRVDNGTVVR